MDLSNALKSDRYLDITMDLEAKGYGPSSVLEDL